MPRMPRTAYQECIVINNASDDIKLKMLEEKLRAEIDEKQNQLVAGDNITIEDNVISAYSQPSPKPEPEPTGKYFVYVYECESPLEGENK